MHKYFLAQTYISDTKALVPTRTYFTANYILCRLNITSLAILIGMISWHIEAQCLPHRTAPNDAAASGQSEPAKSSRYIQYAGLL